MELAAAEGLLSGGISYDLSKAFDRVPLALARLLLQHRGCSPGILKAFDGLYKHQVRRFAIQGCISPGFTPSNGLVQGDPLSMLMLTSLVSMWLECLPAGGQGRVYADDLSAQASSRTTQGLCESIGKVHQHTCRVAAHIGARLNLDKTFTYGHKCLIDCQSS